MQFLCLISLVEMVLLEGRPHSLACAIWCDDMSDHRTKFLAQTGKLDKRAAVLPQWKDIS